MDGPGSTDQGRLDRCPEVGRDRGLTEIMPTCTDRARRLDSLVTHGGSSGRSG